MIFMVRIPTNIKQLLNNKDWLYNEYVILKKDIITIANNLNVSYDTVSRYMRLAGIDGRSRKGCKISVEAKEKISKAWLKKHDGKIYTNKEWLEDQYITQHKSMQKIADIASCDDLMIRNWLKRFEIPIRDHSEAVMGIYNPSYGTHQSLENKRNFTEIMSGENHPNYGKPMSDEQKLKLSISMKGRYVGEKNPFYGKKHTKESLELMSKNRSGVLTGPDNPIYGKSRSPETKQLISEKSKEFWSIPENRERMLDIMHSEEQHKKLSDIAFQHWLDGIYKNHPMHSRGNGCWFVSKKGEKIYLRSSYEVRIAKVLDSLNLDWEYEPESFNIDNHLYHPDFYIKNYNIWWEVKGWMDDYSKYKINSFLEKYPTETLRIIRLDDIIKMESYINENVEFDINSIGNTEVV